MTEPEPAPTLLRVVRGEPTDEELAALVVALSAVRPAAPPPRPRSVWADRGRLLRRPMRPGADAWRHSL